MYLRLAAQDEHAVEVNDLVSGYIPEVPILNGMSLCARDGQVTLVIGPNGAGK